MGEVDLEALYKDRTVVTEKFGLKNPWIDNDSQDGDPSGLAGLAAVNQIDLREDLDAV